MKKQQEESPSSKKDQDMKLDAIEFGPSVQETRRVGHLKPLGSARQEAIEIDVRDLIAEERGQILPRRDGQRCVAVKNQRDGLDILVRLGMKLAAAEAKNDSKSSIFLRLDYVEMSITVLREIIDYLSIPALGEAVELYSKRLVFVNPGVNEKLGLYFCLSAIQRFGMIYEQQPVAGDKFLYAGKLPKQYMMILDRLADLGTATAAEIEERMNLSSADDVKNRLKALYDFGLILRSQPKRTTSQEKPSERRNGQRGREAFIYHFFDPRYEFDPPLDERPELYSIYDPKPLLRWDDLTGEGGPLHEKK